MTPPRACARATTSAPSTAPSSIPTDRSSWKRRRTRSRITRTPCAKQAILPSPPKCRRRRSSTTPRIITSSIWPRTPMAIAVWAGRASAVVYRAKPTVHPCAVGLSTSTGGEAQFALGEADLRGPAHEPILQLQAAAGRGLGVIQHRVEAGAVSGERCGEQAELARVQAFRDHRFLQQTAETPIQSLQ